MMRSYLDFEKPVAELENKVEELRALQETGNAVAIGEEIARLETKAAAALDELYASLTPWQKTQVARDPRRPHCLDYVGALITDFAPLAGDRKFGDDSAIVGGFGRFNGESICDPPPEARNLDRKSTRLNSSHQIISYAVFCLKKK